MGDRLTLQHFSKSKSRFWWWIETAAAAAAAQMTGQHSSREGSSERH
jgi:hypothetical protein